MSAPHDVSLHDGVRILRRRWRLVAGTALGLATATLVLAPVTPTRHEAVARLKWSRTDSITGLFLEAFSWSPGDDLATQAQIIRSKPIALRSAQRLGLLPAGAGLEAVLAEPSLTRTLDDVIASYKAQPLESTSLIEIRASRGDAREAVALANALLEEAIHQHTFERNRQAIEAREFVEKQVADVGGRLEAAEDRLTTFKERHRGASRPAAQEIQYFQDEAARTEARIVALEGLAALLDHGAGPGSTPEILLVDLSEEGLAAIRDELGRLEDRRRQLLAIQREDSPEVQALSGRIDRIVERLRRETRTALDLARRRRQVLDERLAAFPRAEQTFLQLQREVQVNAEAYEMLMRKHQEALIKEADKVQELSAVEYAARAEPIRGPGRWLRTLAGLLVGLILGLVGAFVAEALDTSITRLEDVEQGLGLPVIGVIPPFDATTARRSMVEAARGVLPPPLPTGPGRLVTRASPHGPAAEAYRSLRTNVEFARLGRAGRTFLFTSAVPAEGKSTTVANLAVSMAQMGLRVLAWDCDLRHPAQHQFFDVPRDPGFTQVILGQVSLKEALRRPAGLPDGLHLLTSGPLPPNPSEILASPQVRAFVAETAARYDVVLIDAPPILPVTDAAILAARVDGVIFVIEPGKVGRAVLRRARAHLENVGGAIHGIVLNDRGGTIASLNPELAYLYHHYESGVAEFTRDGRSPAGKPRRAGAAP